MSARPRRYPKPRRVRISAGLPLWQRATDACATLALAPSTALHPGPPHARPARPRLLVHRDRLCGVTEAGIRYAVLGRVLVCCRVCSGNPAESVAPRLTSGLVLLVEDPRPGFSTRFSTSPRLRGPCGQLLSRRSAACLDWLWERSVLISGTRGASSQVKSVALDNWATRLLPPQQGQLPGFRRGAFLFE